MKRQQLFNPTTSNVKMNHALIHAASPEDARNQLKDAHQLESLTLILNTKLVHGGKVALRSEMEMLYKLLASMTQLSQIYIKETCDQSSLGKANPQVIEYKSMDAFALAFGFGSYETPQNARLTEDNQPNGSYTPREFANTFDGFCP